MNCIDYAPKIDFQNCFKGHSGDKNVVYKSTDERDLVLSYYLPPAYDKSKKYPCFIFIHGGGWHSRNILGDQSDWSGDYLGYLARYYANKSFVAVSIDYRLMRESGQAEGFQLIDLYEDCYDAVKYITDNSSEYGIDTESIFLLGESAGGYLAAALATFPYKPKQKFSQVFLVNSIVDIYNDKVWNKYSPKKSDNVFLKGLSEEEIAVALSPVYQLQSHQSSFVLFHGKDDTVVNPRQSYDFYEKAKLLSNESEIHIFECTNHAFLCVEYTQKYINACKETIKIIDCKLREKGIEL